MAGLFEWFSPQRPKGVFYSVGLEQQGSKKGQTFTKDDRLLQRSDFIRLANQGKRFQNRRFIAFAQKNEISHCRLGMTVTRKVGKAVARNRIKRLAREYFRQNRKKFNAYWDINLIAKIGSGDISNQAILTSLENIFERIAAYPQD